MDTGNRQILVDNFRLWEEFSPKEPPMNAPDKPPPKKPKLEARPNGKQPDGDEMYERVMKRYPKTMARLAE